ncbi:MAG: hypothetical protein Q9217_006447, partial [Psora testacea]
ILPTNSSVAAMNDPSSGVHPQLARPTTALLRHIHLVCNHKYAVMPTPSIEVMVKHLQEAPKVTRDISTMTWMALLEPPRDGTLMLVWQPPQMQTHFASDGYLWADPERAFSQQMRGFTVEMYVHNSGFRPGIEGMATHARRRYRLMPGREPVPNLPPMDPSLWLIHYYATEPVNQIPTRNIQVGEQADRLMAERNSLQGHGQLQLQHKEFMLRDRDNWPTLNLPGSNASAYPQQPVGYPNNVMAHMSRSQHPAYMQQTQAVVSQGGIGPSPAKRQRHASASQGQGSVTAIPMPVVLQDAAFDDEETALGADYMDVLTPQQISRSRYVQHHEWLEEILNSPYDTHRIIPGALGLGRKGELESLTKDFFDAPENGLAREVLDLPGTPQEEDIETGRSMVPDDEPPKRIGRMEAGKAEDFTKRAAQRMADLHAEMEKLKTQHARRIANITKGQSWRQAEQSLRTATLELMNGDASRVAVEQDEQTDQIIKSMESTLGSQIKAIKEVECIEKGGLEEKPQANASVDADTDMSDTVLKAHEPPNQIPLEPELQAQVSSTYITPIIATPQAAEPALTPQQQPPPPNIPVGGLEALPEPKDTPADDWVMVNKDADATAQYQDHDHDQSAFDSFTNDAAMQMDDNSNHADNPEDAGPTASGLTFEDNDFGGGIDFGDLDTAGDELSGYTHEIQNMGANDQQAFDLGDTSIGNTFQNVDAPSGQGDQAAP